MVLKEIYSLGYLGELKTSLIRFIAVSFFTVTKIRIAFYNSKSDAVIYDGMVRLLAR